MLEAVKKKNVKNAEIKFPNSSCLGQINLRVTSTGVEVMEEKVH